MNNDRSYESGRYVWAAVLIILAVVLAAVAFVTWVIRADDAENNARFGYADDGRANGTFELAEQDVGLDNRPYDTTTDYSIGDTVDNTYNAR